MSKAQTSEVPPRPEEILDSDRIAYQAMSDLSDEKYADLAKDIRKRGVLDTILIDENDRIIDGHHREAIVKYYELDGSRAPSYLRLGDLKDDNEKLARAIKQNLLGRDTTDAVKREAVEKYIKRAWPRDDESEALVKKESQSEVADALGVDASTVSRVLKNLQAQVIKHDRLKAREYYRENPDASYREVSQQVDASNPTVTSWLKEDFDEEDEDETESQPLNLFARNESEKEDTREITQKANEGDDEAKEQVERLAEGKTTPDTASRRVEQKEREEETPDLEAPDGEYSVLLADPPWNYDFSRSSSRDIENQYATMSLSDIKKLDVPAADDCVLYLWAVAPKVPEAVAVLDAWGFEYKTCAVWDKEKIGMGYWFRGQHELLLVGTRGDVSPPDTDARVSSVIREERGEHSEKPETVHEIIEDAFPTGDRVELFARDGREGWETWGAEA